MKLQQSTSRQSDDRNPFPSGSQTQYQEASHSDFALQQTRGMASFEEIMSHPGIMTTSLQDGQGAGDNGFSAFLAGYQPQLSDPFYNTSIPDTAHLGLAPMMGSTMAHTQLDPATAAAAAAAYGTLGRAVIGQPAQQQDALAPEAHKEQSYAPGVNNNFANSGAVYTGQQHGADSLYRASTSGKHSRHSESSFAGNATGGVGYEGDGSNSASTQTPAPSSSGDDQDNLRMANANNTNQFLPLQPLPEYLRSSSSASTSSPSIGRVGDGQQQNPVASSISKRDPSNRVRRAQSGFKGSGASLPQQAPLASDKRFSGPAITTSGTSNNPRPTGHHANAAVHHSVSKSMAAGHAASHPPGTGSQVLRGADHAVNGSNAASDFTRRKGWHTRIVDELLDFVHILDKDGKMLFAASSVGAISGWKPEELKGHSISEFIHPDDAKDFMSELESAFKDRSELVHYYRFRKKPQTAADRQKVREQVAAAEVGRSGSTSEGDSSNQDSSAQHASPKFTDVAPNHRAGLDDDDEAELLGESDKYVVLEISGHPYVWSDDTDVETAAQVQDSADRASRLPNSSPKSKQYSSAKSKAKTEKETAREDGSKGEDRPKIVQCFFCSGRVYPTKNVGMLDSFLELKLENERLRTMLGELSLHDGSTEQTGGSSEGRRSLEEVGYHPDYANFDNAQAHIPSHHTASASFDAAGNSERYAAPGVPMVRRSSNFSASGFQSTPTSPLSARADGTAGGVEAIPDDEEASEEDANPIADEDNLGDKHKKKKPKQEEGDFVCTDCGRVDSPEWRKGPLGPKTLCNACGLRWAKKVKRSGGDPNALTGKGLHPGANPKLQQPFSDFNANRFADETQRSSLSNEPPGGHISGAPAYAMSGQSIHEAMPEHHHSGFPGPYPQQSYPQPPAQMGPQEQQSMLGVIHALYHQSDSFAASAQHNHHGGAMPPMPQDPGAAHNFLGQNPALSSVLMNPQQPQMSDDNMTGHMYGGNAP